MPDILGITRGCERTERRVSRTDAIAGDLLNGILAGDYPPDTALPSEHTLMEMYQTSRPTVREALNQLANNGRIESRHGSGWFVQPDIRRDFPLLRIDQGRVHASKDVWGTWLEGEQLRGDALLRVYVAEPPKHVRDHLRIETGEQCAIRERIRRIDRQPVTLSVGYFPMWLAAGTDLAVEGGGDAVDMQHPSPLGLLHQMGHAPAHDEDRIGTRMPTDTEREQLTMPPGNAVLTVCRTSTDRMGHPVRCTSDVHAGHRFYLVVEQHY